jgi:Activator of Hsp90 ATPase homolog 1-like protein
MRTIMLLLLLTMLTVPAGASNRVLTTEFEVNAPIEKVWAAWTTPEGIKTFYAPDCKVDLQRGWCLRYLLFAGSETGRAWC